MFLSGMAPLYMVLLIGQAEPAPETNKDRKVPIIDVERNNDAMNQAMANSRKSVEEFRRLLADPDQAGRTFAVKKRFEDGKQTEYMWLDQLKDDGKFFEGRLNNDPERVENAKSGERYRVAHDEIADWMVTEYGRIYGAYTVRVLTEREEAGDFRELKKVMAPLGDLPDSKTEKFAEGRMTVRVPNSMMMLVNDRGDLSLAPKSKESAILVQIQALAKDDPDMPPNAAQQYVLGTARKQKLEPVLLEDKIMMKEPESKSAAGDLSRQVWTVGAGKVVVLVQITIVEQNRNNPVVEETLSKLHWIVASLTEVKPTADK